MKEKNKRDQLRSFKIKTVLFVYKEIFNFPGDKREISLFVSKNFVTSVINFLLYCDIWVHHSHVSGNIHGYAHDFCNRKVKELNNQPISGFAHNLFRFDFFFVLKELRLSVWRTKDLNMDGKGIRNMSYTSIADQVKFIDTIKFYQEPLHALAPSMEPAEHENIKKSITTFLETHPRFSFKYSTLTFENKKWVVDYLSGGKGVIPCDMIKQWEDLNIAPTLNENFFAKTAFYSSLKNSTITDEEYEDVQKLFSVMKMSNLSGLNALYNFQNTIILAEIFENRASIMHEKFGYNPFRCSSTSTLSGAIQRHTSKVIISFPTNAGIIELMEKTLIGGMSIVNTRVAFDSNIFIKGKEQTLVYKIRNKATNEMEDKRVSAVILKMDENNHYGNAMTKPLPIGCIKKEPSTPSIRELCLLLSGLSHLDPIGHLFVVDIEFNFERATEEELFLTKFTLLCLKKRRYYRLAIGQFFNYLTLLG